MAETILTNREAEMLIQGSAQGKAYRAMPTKETPDFHHKAFIAAMNLIQAVHAEMEKPENRFLRDDAFHNKVQAFISAELNAMSLDDEFLVLVGLVRLHDFVGGMRTQTTDEFALRVREEGNS